MPGANQILAFCPTDTGANLLSQAAYLAASGRVSGNAPGIADLTLVNKALRQANLMAAALAQYVADNQGADVVDTLTPAAVSALLTTALAPVRPGQVFAFSGTAAPAGCLACPTAPATVSRTTYAALFAAIGTTWGVGDGATTFGIPWFAADMALVQANANVGSTTIGSNLAHNHAQQANTLLNGGATDGLGTTPATITSGGSTAYSGGSANLAAGTRVLFCVKY